MNRYIMYSLQIRTYIRTTVEQTKVKNYLFELLSKLTANKMDYSLETSIDVLIQLGINLVAIDFDVR